MIRKRLALVTAMCIALAFSGCSTAQPKEQAYTPPTVTEPTEDHSLISDELTEHDDSMYAVVLPPVMETAAAQDGTILFTQSFQDARLLLHNTETENKIIADLQSRIASFLSDADEIKLQAQSDYADHDGWSEYFIDVSYTPTRLDQAVLSLFGNSFSYCGGPHPSLVTDSVNYDLQTGNVIFLDDILVPGCKPDTIYQLLLSNLSNQAEDLYYDYADALGDRFTGDLHSIQDWYFSRNGLCFHFAPYDIAPYSSGTIIAELPYSSLTDVLKEKYIPANPSAETGSMYAETYSENDSDRFHLTAHAVLDENGNDILLYPDATVSNLRIESGTRYSDSNQYISGATVFAANTMNVGDAIHLTADLINSDTVLRLVYHSGNQEYSSFITYDEAEDTILLTNN